ncbi:Ig-like domain-containing protein [Deinococcus frigens]|uniref:Ig-like domain-containing protein n=1 Tax=Deinococcus frigens TaxID=249403 RepID=UPI000A4BF29F|nr:Ig-like domain-containing protein [Deinococcus frigens]
MFRRPAAIALSLTASIAIVSCNSNSTPTPTATVTKVTVTPEVASLVIGANVQAKATVTGTNSPSQTVTWASSNPNIATVSSTGLITAVAPGNAVVSANATVAGFTNQSDSVKVTVTAPTSTTPTVTKVAVTLNPTTVAVGGTSKATATVTGTNNPAQTVTWTSSNMAVATVDAAGNVQALTAGSTDIIAVSTVDGAQTGKATLTVTAVVINPTLTTAKINFQTAAAPTPAGYTPNTGTAYTAASMTGWVTETSAGTAAPVPLDLTGNARYRTVDGTNVVAGLDARLYTQIQMQCGTPTTGNTCNAPATNTSGAFEYKVVNGKYNVTVSVGDADKRNLNSLHTINVENVNAIKDFTPTLATQFKTATVTVTVADGKLTIDAKGGKNTKINYVDIVPAP